MTAQNPLDRIHVDDEPVYNTRIWRAYYYYVVANYGKELFEDICKTLKMPLNFILSDGNWVSNKFASDFTDLLIQKTGDQDICRKVGLYAASPEVLNYIEYTLITNILSPYFFYIAMTREYSKFNRFNTLSVVKKLPGHFEFKVIPKGKGVPHPHICKNTVGMLSCTKDLFHLDFINVEHTKCIHRGDPFCTFDVHYAAIGFWGKKLKGTALFTGILAAIKEGLAYWGGKLIPLPTIWVFSTLLSAVLLTLIVYVRRHYNLVKYISHYHEQSNEKSKELYNSYKKLDRRYTEANLVREFTFQVLQNNISTQDLIQSCLETIINRFQYTRAFLMQVSDREKKLYTSHAVGFSKFSSVILNLSVNYPPSKQEPLFFSSILDSSKTVLIADIKEFSARLKESNKQLINEIEVKSLIVAPLVTETQKLGLLVVGTVDGEQMLTTDDLHIIESISRLIAILIQKNIFVEKELSLKRLFKKYVPNEVLRSIEAEGDSFLKPRHERIAAVFIDIRGYTTLSETLLPEKLFELLNTYLTFCIERLAKYGAIIDKILGDGIVVLFRGSDSYQDPSQAALAACCEILADLPSFGASLEARGLPQCSIGIGVHTGPALLGNVGSATKLNFTAIGDTVNLAARLQEFSKTHGAETVNTERGVMVTSITTIESSNLKLDYKDLGNCEIRGRVKTIHAAAISPTQASTFIKSAKTIKAA